MTRRPPSRRSPARRRVDRLPASTLLHLMRLASPSLPVGGFSYSEGLETAVETGRVRGDAAVLAWLSDQLRLGLGRSELPIVAHAARAWRLGDRVRLAELNDWFAVTRETGELRRQAEQMGRSLAQWLGHRDPADARVAVLLGLGTAPTWPVAFALAGIAIGAPIRELLLAFAAGWAENMVQAAMKSVPLGQAAGQRLMAGLSDAIPDVVDAARALPFDAAQAYTPMLAIVSSQHEAQYSRLFRS